MSRARPILFSAPMSRAEREDRKNQTRRICVGQRERSSVRDFPVDRCPYGVPGDLLWVREEHYRFGHWDPVEGARTKGGRQKWAFVADADDVLFDPPPCFLKSRPRLGPAAPAWYKRLARFMPRRLSRTTLEVVSVRVERLHDISEEDAIAEGVERGADFFQCPMWKDYLPGEGGPAWFPDDPIGSFRSLWESINGLGSWDPNPLVWVVEFKRSSEAA